MTEACVGFVAAAINCEAPDSLTGRGLYENRALCCYGTSREYREAPSITRGGSRMPELGPYGERTSAIKKGSITFLRATLAPSLNVCSWHFASFAASQYFWSLSGAQRTLIGNRCWIARSLSDLLRTSVGGQHQLASSVRGSRRSS